MDAKILSSVAQLTNAELLARVKHFAECERSTTATLIAHLSELDKRRLYLAEGCSSLFTYCTQILCLSEHAAYGRIEAARIVQRFPVILEMLEKGSLNLTTVCLLATHLTDKNHREVLEQARHKSKRQVEELLARLHPQAAVPSTIRKLPIPSRVSGLPEAAENLNPSLQPADQNQDPSLLAIASPPSRPATIVPLAPERYKVQFTVSAETHKKLRLAQNLLRHQIPDGDPAAIFDRALSLLLDYLVKKRLAVTERPREGRDNTSGSRHIPSDVRRGVWLRDGGRCAFVGENGRRCMEEGFLVYHHVTPHASGGPPTMDNIQLRCRAHNVFEAELECGTYKPQVLREHSPFYVVPVEGQLVRSEFG
jgi:hypothetical protein